MLFFIILHSINLSSIMFNQVYYVRARIEKKVFNMLKGYGWYVKFILQLSYQAFKLITIANITSQIAFADSIVLAFCTHLLLIKIMIDMIHLSYDAVDRVNKTAYNKTMLMLNDNHMSIKRYSQLYKQINTKVLCFEIYELLVLITIYLI